MLWIEINVACKKCMNMLMYYHRWSFVVSFLFMPIFNNYPKQQKSAKRIRQKNRQGSLSKSLKKLQASQTSKPKVSKYSLTSSELILSSNLGWEIPTFSRRKRWGTFFFETCWCDIRFFKCFFTMNMMGKCWMQTWLVYSQLRGSHWKIGRLWTCPLSHL